MAADSTSRACLAIHATAVAIGDRALLIRGASRAGKSRLACALIARSSPVRPIRLIGDDRILLHRAAGGFVARPHPRIAGFIERRGLGFVAMPWVAQARVCAVLDLRHSGASKAHPAGVCILSEDGTGFGFSLGEPLKDGGDDFASLPRLALDAAEDSTRADHVLAWWSGLSAACAPHLAAKADGARLACAKD